jgi:ribose-phosphate pyrophosphokinase
MKIVSKLNMSNLSQEMKSYVENFVTEQLAFLLPREVDKVLRERRIGKLRLISGTSNEKLSQDIAAYIGLQPSQVILGKFNDGQLQVQIKDNVRGCHVVIVQTSVDTDAFTQNDHLEQTILMISACKLADAKSIQVVCPFFPYARSDKKDDGRVAIGAAVAVRQMERAGASSFIAVDLHSGQIQGFTECPFDNLYGMNSLMDHLKQTIFTGIPENILRQQFVVVSPDQGGAKRARAWGQKLGFNTAVMDKHRNYSQPGTVIDSDLIGDVAGKDCIIVDDMYDTGGTMMAACKELKKRGANKIYIVVTHGVCSKKRQQSETGEITVIDPIDVLATNVDVDYLFVTDTIDQSQRTARCNKIISVTVASLLGEAIKRHRTGESISELFL